MTTTFSKESINSFADYVMSFYGPDGIYPMIPALNFTVIKSATNDHIRICKIKGQEFCGDSYDRELVRDLLISKYNLEIA
jgi:hypothetical protein